jgi:NAD(P)-dependent dehydrogenase (short-subunit alcohol dehydrogenase family)
MDLRNSVALITGGSKGIGKGIAQAMAAEGCRLVITARSPGPLEDTSRALAHAGAEVVAVSGDVGSEEDTEKMVNAAIENFGRLDILVNNAGIGHKGPVEEMAARDWDDLFRTNVRGPFLLVKSTIPYMKKQGSGTIVNVASLAGKNPVPGMACYAATKWALHGFSVSIMGELRKHNIRTILVNPGSTATEFSPPPTEPEKRMRILQPEDVASILLEALKRPDRAMVSEIDLRPTNP